MPPPERVTDRRLALMTAEIPRLQRYARAVCPSREEADDLLQDTLLRAVTKMSLWREGTNMRAWLFTILQRQRITRLRRAARRRDYQAFEDECLGLWYPANQVDSVELREVEAAIAQLSPEHAEVLRLVVLQNLTYEEAAEALDCAVGTIRSRLSRARARLHRSLEEPRHAPRAA